MEEGENGFVEQEGEGETEEARQRKEYFERLRNSLLMNDTIENVMPAVNC